jgi:hypothetical protein
VGLVERLKLNGSKVAGTVAPLDIASFVMITVGKDQQPAELFSVLEKLSLGLQGHLGKLIIGRYGAQVQVMGSRDQIPQEGDLLPPVIHQDRLMTLGMAIGHLNAKAREDLRVPIQ